MGQDVTAAMIMFMYSDDYDLLQEGLVHPGNDVRSI